MSAITNLNRYIDHTLLKADATTKDIEKLCKEAVEQKFYSVCVNSVFAQSAKKFLNEFQPNVAEGSEDFVHLCCVVGFPLGAMTTAAKVFEASECIRAGANEIDMVIAVGKLKEQSNEYVQGDIRALVEECKKSNTLLKVIIETALLSDEEKERVVNLAIDAGADFVKTSTGFSTGGAKKEDVALMHRLSHPKGVKVKASGGVRSLQDAQMFIETGASRLGTSSGVKIMNGEESTSSY